MVDVFWAAAARLEINPFIDRVASRCNISDSLSRGDFSLAEKLGWRRVYPDFNALWPALLDFIETPRGTAGIFAKIWRAAKGAQRGRASMGGALGVDGV